MIKFLLLHILCWNVHQDKNWDGLNVPELKRNMLLLLDMSWDPSRVCVTHLCRSRTSRTTWPSPGCRSASSLSLSAAAPAAPAAPSAPSADGPSAAPRAHPAPAASERWETTPVRYDGHVALLEQKMLRIQWRGGKNNHMSVDLTP